MTPTHFADNLNARIKKTSIVMLGIDPNFDLMPFEMRPALDLEGDLEIKLWNFCKSLIDQTHELVCGIKPQSAYFEQYGSVGVRVLAKVVAYAKTYGLVVLMDAKRGDIGATSGAYAKAYLMPSQYRSDLESDALTVNPFLGLDTLEPFIKSTLVNKGIFVLVKTSNPGSGFIQNVEFDSLTVSQKLANWIEAEGQNCLGQSGYSNIGAVVGATKPEDALELRRRMPSSIFLAPGVGAQGGDVEAIMNLLDANGLGVVVPISRAINYPVCLEGEAWLDAVRRSTLEYCTLLKTK